LEAKGKTEDAGRLRQTLNTKSTRKAHKQAEATGLLAPKAEKPKAATHQKQTFNLTNDKIEWARWTWNPVTGCEHGCEDCYARDIAEPPSDAFPFGFKPALREERLTAPKDMGKPSDHLHKLGEDARKGIGYKTVFAVSMGDLFGEWVPQAWIDGVLDAIREGPEWNFLFLTKNPERLADIQWPDNAWVGTTVDCQERVKRAQEAFRGVEATVRFLSCEPLTEELVFDDLSMFEWMIVGGQSKSSNLPARQPELFWAASLMLQAASFGVRVYCKPNLTVVKQYPEVG
jgi:protein gp37